MLRLKLTAVAALAAVLAFGAGNARAVLPTLYVHYTQSCTFTVIDDNGKAVSSIAPGSYQVEVNTPVDFGSGFSSSANDFTNCHGFVQFQLTGPGVSLTTTLDDGDSTDALMTATFKASSSYTMVDNNQPSVTRFVFSTTATGTPLAPAAPVSTVPQTKSTGPTELHGCCQTFQGSLVAIVSKAGTVSLTRKGKSIVSLKSGRWKVSVTDHSTKAGFSLQVIKAKAQPITTASYVGKHVATVSMKPGRWSFFTSGGAKTTFFVVS